MHSLKTFENTLVCVGLRRIVSVAFLRRVQIILLSYLSGTVCARNFIFGVHIDHQGDLREKMQKLGQRGSLGVT